MKKQKIQEDYPLEEVTMDDVYRLQNAGWVAESERSGEIKFTRKNKAGILSVKFVKIIG